MKLLIRTSFGLLAMGLMAAQAQVNPVPPPAPQAPDADTSATGMPRILNETPQFCARLEGDIARLRASRGDISAEAATLTREGARMCRIGHYRPGIYRLRTALMLLRREP